MKAERYLLNYIERHNISHQQVEKVAGINMQDYVNNQKELNADEFMKLCIFLGVNPDDIMRDVI